MNITLASLCRWAAVTCDDPEGLLLVRDILMIGNEKARKAVESAITAFNAEDLVFWADEKRQVSLANTAMLIKRLRDIAGNENILLHLYAWNDAETGLEYYDEDMEYRQVELLYQAFPGTACRLQQIIKQLVYRGEK